MKQDFLSGPPLLCCHLVGHLDVEENVIVLAFVDVGQSSGVRLVFRHRADPVSFMLINNHLKYKTTQRSFCFSMRTLSFKIIRRTKKMFVSARAVEKRTNRKNKCLSYLLFILFFAFYVARYCVVFALIMLDNSPADVLRCVILTVACNHSYCDESVRNRKN